MVTGPLRRVVVVCLGVWCPCQLLGQGAAPGKLAARELMKRGLYKDAVRVLLKEIRQTPESDRGEKYLMLAESYYMLKEYARAKPYFEMANAQVAAEGKVIAEYRLACIAYRLGEADGALKKIDSFVGTHPTDRRAGILLLFKMKLLARQGARALARIEAVHEQLHKRFRRSNYAIGVAADKVLTDFYLAHGQEEKAKERYASIVHGFRNAITQYAREKRPVPPGLEQAHDDAAMQLGIISLKAERYDDAVKWLENVRYNAELKRKSRLLLAQVAYQKRDFNRAIWYLTRDGFLDTVPQGSLRSDIHLLLGLCQRSKTDPDLNKAVAYLGQVGPNSRGYFQAQAALGDLYRERGLVDRAIRAYEKAVASPTYQAHGLFQLGTLYMTKADELQDQRQKDAVYRKAAENFSQLATKYPSGRLTKQASAAIEALLKKGYDVKVARTDEQMIRGWEQTARNKKGSAEAARALLNLARLHARTLLDEKAQRYVKAPDYPACVRACDRILDPKDYTGQGLAAEQWKDMQAEALYYRGLSYVSSAGADTQPGVRGARPVWVKSPDLQQAIRDFSRAKELVDPTRLDLVKSIDLGHLEAMFKSDKPEHREKAEAHFAELANEYGTDPRFQKLAMDLAEWYRRQKRYAEAAREYKGIADRGTNLSRDDRLKALFMAGKLYSMAAHDVGEAPEKIRYGIYIYPREVIRLPDILKTYPPFRKKIRIQWPGKSETIKAGEALKVVSQASGIPFVWRPERSYNSVARYLDQKRVRVESLTGTAAGFLRQILDLNTHRLTFDIGITGGQPTIKPRKTDPDDPERPDSIKTIEIYDARRWDYRYAPLAHRYGVWREVHPEMAMLYNVVERIEKVSGTKVLWAPGVDKVDALSREYRELPGVGRDRSCSCAEVLRRLLEPTDLRFKIVPRNLAGELYEQAMDCFNEIRQIEPKSEYGEKSLFMLALNFHRQEDFERMKIVLKEYLKLFDAPEHEMYHEACFWVGWVFEHEKRYRDACRYYGRAAEERLVIYKPRKKDKPPTREQLKAQVPYDTLFVLEEPVQGAFKGASLAREFLEFIRLNSNLIARIDASAVGIETPIEREPFAKVPLFDVICDVLDRLGLALRIENVNEKAAEKAYYRQAAAYKKDGLMEQALMSCNVLLKRFPNTGRKRDALKLKLEIYKGLKDYRNVLATLETFKTELKGQIEPYKIDFEIAWIYFDLCRYGEAATYFARSLAAAPDPAERLKIRDGHARALFRAERLPEALDQYKALSKQESQPLRAFVDEMMVWYLEAVLEKKLEPRLPDYASKFIRAYEKLTNEQRAQLSQTVLAKATWIYYVSGLIDLRDGRVDRAVKKLAAAGNSPDDWLAADAIFRVGLIHMQAKRFKEARDQFEYLLFSTKSAEAEVKATYALGLCHRELGDPTRAQRRFDQLLKRFPDSSYAERVRSERPGQPKTTTRKAVTSGR